MCAHWPSAAAEWAKPYKSAAALRRRACEIIITPICAYSCAYGYCVTLGGVWDADFQLCVFLEHVCKLLRKVAFFPRAEPGAKFLPPPAAKIRNDQVGLVA